ncbi:Cys/Met metabolism pyridoxal phosphate-dependent enzyme [Penicillium verhagenii]|uniref:Cys/Met metabolism pyridoxal phosphate-dependent enzyme n=1 Tax=Penicillium verhagenii TaxID=1562060 RepID=UPI0025459385|nr:Cys/Met metabolism pyridoxal phosphate-dependent enzyme [Penicillium verhagenii]KAJ5920919.1 Cys/Met metabolism pyridoxal phosphate-dependent enzyme [Penicillium verhagenii]
MKYQLPPPLGHAVPVSKEHAISVHFPAWADVAGYGAGKAEVSEALQNGYPRTFLHKCVREFFDTCIRNLPTPAESIAVFPDYDSAADCRSFLLDKTLNPDGAVDEKDTSLFAVKLSKGPSQSEVDFSYIPQLYAVTHPHSAESVKMTFWRLNGRGISSRLAKQCLQCIEFQLEPTAGPLQDSPSTRDLALYETLRKRVADLLSRAPIDATKNTLPTSNDVYLSASGMAALYHVNQALLRWRSDDIVMLGFPYELSIKMIETIGVPYHLYSYGLDKDIDNLEALLIERAKEGRKIQSVWCECPNNPVLRTPDMHRVRDLANKYDFVFVVDDTIGSAANIDVSDVADVIVTSLTKNFSGYADVLGGCVTLNPKFPHYQELSTVFAATHVNNLYAEDAIQLELNSRNYLERFTQQNRTAAYLIDFLHPYIADPSSGLNAIYSPRVCWSRENYCSFMRPATEEFEPGFGSVFGVDFENVEQAAAFFDNFPVCKGPSFGANVTIALPYVQLVMQNQKEWAKGHGLNETLIRISIGLEDPELLLGHIKRALQAANDAKTQCCSTCQEHDLH